MKKCGGCEANASIGYYAIGYTSTVYNYCSHECFENFWTYNGSTIGAITRWYTQLSPEDYTLYCAMEAL